MLADDVPEVVRDVTREPAQDDIKAALKAGTVPNFARMEQGR